MVTRINPIGVKPQWLHNEHRLQQIDKAIARYTEAKCRIPVGWIREKKELQKWLLNWSLERERRHIFPNSRVGRFMLKFWTNYLLYHLMREYPYPSEQNKK